MRLDHQLTPVAILGRGGAASSRLSRSWDEGGPSAHTCRDLGMGPDRRLTPVAIFTPLAASPPPLDDQTPRGRTTGLRREPISPDDPPERHDVPQRARMLDAFVAICEESWWLDVPERIRRESAKMSYLVS